jgi:hypothetical protein
MPPTRTLPAFTPGQRDLAHRLLAAKVARMMGRKLEEGDWADVYCRARGIPNRGWSNLNIDVMHEGLGVEHKMLCYRSKASILQACGETLMHPAATRSIRIPTGKVAAERAMREILQQYAELIRQRTEKVREQAPAGTHPNMRTGWLLWQESLRQFLYFEESMEAPDPTQYTAQWVESGGGSRKGSRNLWIYERATGKKRFSVTTSAGAKIQPYFDVPPPNDPNLYIFTVIGEVILDGRVRCWLTRTTFQDLEQLLGRVSSQTISRAIQKHLSELPAAEAGPFVTEEPAEAVEISADAYALLTSRLPGVNDDHCFQLLVRLLRKKGR